MSSVLNPMLTLEGISIILSLTRLTFRHFVGKITQIHSENPVANIDYFSSLKDDSVEINLGYVYNAGFTRKWGTNKPEDNQLAVKVLSTLLIVTFVLQ